jgi:16S rRNA processing protein RimM
VAAWDDYVLVGHIARPHGHRGQVIVNARTDFVAERFASGATIWVLRNGVPTSLVIQDARIHKERPVLTLEGVASMNDALELHGAEIRVPPETQAALPDGEFYHHELIGCEVVTVDGREVGTVKAVEGATGAQHLVIGAEGKKDVLVPLAWSICVEIDPEGKRIAIDPPDGLLELNA